MQNHIKKFREVYIFAIIACVVFFVIGLMVKADLSHKVLQYASHVSNQDEFQFVHDFTSGMQIKQTFSSPMDFEFITLSFSDHEQPMYGKVALFIEDKNSGESLIYRELEADKIFAGTPVEISFADIGGGEAKRQYEITLLAVDAGEEALGVYGYKTDSDPAIVDGKESEYALSIGMHSYTGLYRSVTAIIMIIGAIAVLGVIAGTFIFRINEQRMFLLLAIPLMVCMLILWPGNDVYDEIRHYYTTYHFSNVLLGSAGQDTTTTLNMRQCDIDPSGDGRRYTPVNAQAQRLWYDYACKLRSPVESREMVLTDISNLPIIENGTFLEYLPSILGMTLARLLGCNYFWMVTIAKIVSLAFYTAMCYYAIKTIPIMKMAVAFVSALPILLYEASGITYDSFTYCVGIVVFALIIKLWTVKLSEKEWIFLGITAFALGSCKGGVYLTLLLLLFFIPREKFDSKKMMKCFTILFVGGISMLISFVPTIIRWFGLGKDNTINISNTVLENGNYHIVFAFKRPMEFVKLLIFTLMENADEYLGQILGDRTAWTNQPLSLAIVLPFLILLVLAAAKMKDENFEISIVGRAGLFLIVLVELIGLHSIFLVETSSYSNVIKGFQGRYFMLFIPCILLLFRNNGLVFKEKAEYLYPCFSMAQMVYLYFFLKMFMCN